MMVQNVKCLLFLHLAGSLPKNIVILFRKDQILTAKWHDSTYVQLLAICHSRLENKSLNMYSKVSIISAGLIVNLTIFPFHSPPQKISDFCHTLLLNCPIYPASWNHEIITI